MNWLHFEKSTRIIIIGLLAIYTLKKGISLRLVQPCIDAFFGWKIGISVAKTGWVAGQNHHQLQLLSALKVISKWIFISLLRKNSHSRIFSAMENRICILFFIIIVIASKVNGSTQSTYEACQILMTSQLAADLKPSIIRYLACHSSYYIDHFLGLSTYNECLWIMA